MVLFRSRSVTHLSPGGFQGSLPPLSQPPSRPPTKMYDRQSQVLVVSKNEDILKFMKMHLNRYFSHVQVNKSYSGSYALLKQKSVDVVIAEATREFKPTMEFVKKVGQHWRTTPVVIIDPASDLKPEEFSQGLVVSVIAPPFNLDVMHMAIRRCLNLRSSLRDLDTLVPSRTDLAELIRSENPPETHEEALTLIKTIRKLLTEDIID